MIKDSGDRTVFVTGAVRDMHEANGEEKGRCDLLPLREVGEFYIATEDDFEYPNVMEYILDFRKTANNHYLFKAIREGLNPNHEKKLNADIMLELSKHFEQGAEKYGENNWQKGIPVQSYIDSAIRHYIKYKAGWDDERHDRAFAWNLMCCAWTMNNKPEMDDYTMKGKSNEQDQ